MKILITGGAGFIGSAATKKLIDLGYEITVADNLERGNKWAIDSRAKFLKGDLLDEKFIEKIFMEDYDGVLNFAGYISMAESVNAPNLYFRNNLLSVINVLRAMEARSLNNFVFSSSAGVYGDTKYSLIPESVEHSPSNPYSQTKSIVEKILLSKLYKVKSVSLRYFNAAGAFPDAILGEAHKPETHIIPLVIESVLENKEFILFGNDYSTSDGTCVRDYVHVLDLVEAHILALKALWSGKNILPAYNVGTGNGYSNRQIIDAVGKFFGKKVKVNEYQRREGDVASLVADNRSIKKDFDFKPKYSDLGTIIETACKWHIKAKKENKI